MLPSNLAKGRTAARGLGELLMVGPGTGVLQSLRYSPYSVPSTNTAVVALSQPLSFPSPASAPLVSISGAPGSQPAGLQAAAPQLPPGLQLFGLDSNPPSAAAQAQLSLNQLMAGQLSLKTGSFPYPAAQTCLNQLQTAAAAAAAGGQQTGLNQFPAAAQGLGYNVSDLLNLQGLQGLQGLQVPVGL